MVDPYKQLSPGDPPGIPAKTWNDLVRMLRWWNARPNSGRDTPTNLPNQGIVLIQNRSGDDVQQSGIMGISNYLPLIDPADNLVQFRSLPALVGDAPEAKFHAGRLVITLEPIANGAIGRAVISGIAAVQIEVKDGDIDDDLAYHKNAAIVDGDTTHFTVTAGQGCPIMFLQPGVGMQWAFVLLGAGITPKPPTPPAVLVHLDSDVGPLSGGSGTVYTWDGSALAGTDQTVSVINFRENTTPAGFHMAYQTALTSDVYWLDNQATFL